MIYHYAWYTSTSVASSVSLLMNGLMYGIHCRPTCIWMRLAVFFPPRRCHNAPSGWVLNSQQWLVCEEAISPGTELRCVHSRRVALRCGATRNATHPVWTNLYSSWWWLPVHVDGSTTANASDENRTHVVTLVRPVCFSWQFSVVVWYTQRSLHCISWMDWSTQYSCIKLLRLPFVDIDVWRTASVLSTLVHSTVQPTCITLGYFVYRYFVFCVFCIFVYF